MDVNVFRIMVIRRYLHWLCLACISCFGALTPLSAQQNPHKIGLVLSGGGARGAAHIGVLKVFEQERIPIHCIAATSFGSLVGGLYSLGYSAADIERIFADQDWDSIFSDAPQRRLTRLIERRNTRYQAQISFRGWNPELPTGLLEGQRLTEVLDKLITGRLLQAEFDFDRLPIPFRAVATNLIDGKPYIFQKGSMTEALRASMSIPLLFTPLEKDGMLLADGGLANNLPVDVAKAMGADIIFAVDATSPLLPLDKVRTFVNVIDQSISLQMEQNVQESRKLATILLKPDLEKYTNSDYEKFSEIVKQGEDEAKRRLPELKALVAGIAPRPYSPPAASATPVIHAIYFRGLKQIGSYQLRTSIRVHPGESADPSKIAADVERLYATRLFDSVTYTLEPVGENRYDLIFNTKEALMNTLGASLRYDDSYNFVALAEFTARQLFNSPSTATVSSQFGGLEDHFASLRLSPPQAQFLFLEPKVEAHSLERLDIRNQETIDQFTDKREGGQLVIGATILRQLEISGGYRAERARISGGSPPNRMAGSTVLAGLTFRLNRDSLDLPVFPRSGMLLRAQFDKRSTSLGSDLDYSKLQIDWQRYFSVSANSTFQVSATAGYSHGPVPFYDLFYVGGYSFSERASRPFLGLDRDELLARQIGVFSASYRRQILNKPLGFIKRGFLTGTYNGVLSSTRQASPYDFDLLHGMGVGLALDTMVGPMRAAGGWSEAGRLHFYISIGPSF
jgi:NTE family protein